MKAEAVLRLRIPSKRILEIVYTALMVEVERPATTRSRANLKIEGDLLILTVEAKDTVALRAALNAYLRWMYSCVKLLQTMEKLA
ncbi:MAG: KEOPS complex subunit Pcc1 [Candidatus Bathyarchaeia archaeon]